MLTRRADFLVHLYIMWPQRRTSVGVPPDRAELLLRELGYGTRRSSDVDLLQGFGGIDDWKLHRRQRFAEAEGCQAVEREQVVEEPQ